MTSRKKEKIQKKEDDNKVRKSVVSILCEIMVIDQEEITPKTNIQEDLHADSVDMVEITMCIEEEFDIQIDDEEASNNLTVEKIVDMVEEKIAEISATV